MPGLLDTVVGQQTAVETLRRALAKGLASTARVHLRRARRRRQGTRGLRSGASARLRAGGRRAMPRRAGRAAPVVARSSRATIRCRSTPDVVAARARGSTTWRRHRAARPRGARAQHRPDPDAGPLAVCVRPPRGQAPRCSSVRRAEEARASRRRTRSSKTLEEPGDKTELRALLVGGRRPLADHSLAGRKWCGSARSPDAVVTSMLVERGVERPRAQAVEVARRSPAAAWGSPCRSPILEVSEVRRERWSRR